MSFLVDCVHIKNNKESYNVDFNENCQIIIPSEKQLRDLEQEIEEKTIRFDITVHEAFAEDLMETCNFIHYFEENEDAEIEPAFEDLKIPAIKIPQRKYLRIDKLSSSCDEKSGEKTLWSKSFNLKGSHHSDRRCNISNLIFKLHYATQSWPKNIVSKPLLFLCDDRFSKNEATSDDGTFQFKIEKVTDQLTTLTLDLSSFFNKISINDFIQYSVAVSFPDMSEFETFSVMSSSPVMQISYDETIYSEILLKKFMLFKTIHQVAPDLWCLSFKNRTYNLDPSTCSIREYVYLAQKFLGKFEQVHQNVCTFRNSTNKNIDRKSLREIGTIILQRAISGDKKIEEELEKNTSFRTILWVVLAFVGIKTSTTSMLNLADSSNLKFVFDKEKQVVMPLKQKQ